MPPGKDYAFATDIPEAITTPDRFETSVPVVLLEDYTIGSLRVGQVRLEFSGEDDAVARIQALLEPKLVRAGG